MFVDQARVRTTGGGGGNGCVSFRREKYVPRGGPDGGDGGHGGAVHFIATDRLTSLLDLQYHAHWRGKDGAHGEGGDCHGKTGEDVEVPVPTGTVVRDYETGQVAADLSEDGQRFLAAAGGRGGKGNARFATSTRQAPRFAELGEPGGDHDYLLELKLIAEVGLAGLPNAGKSTFLSVVTAAHPKVADYPFTTLAPNLGVAKLSDYRTLTIADIPGIIEGAAEGKGLGHDFLRHIERTKVLLMMIDLGDSDPLATVETLKQELGAYSMALRDRPKLFAFNKADIPENREKFEAVRQQLPNAYLISCATHEGVEPVLEELWREVERVRRLEAGHVEPEATARYAYEAPYTVEREGGGFRVEGKPVERAVRMTNFGNEEAVRHLQKKLQRLGLFKTLKRMGAQDGQTIRIEDVELEYQSD